MTPDSPWSGLRKVLAVRLDNLGDVLMTTPAIAAIRRDLPGAHITLLGSRSVHMLAPHLSVIDEVMSYDAPWVRGPCGAAADDLRFIDALAAREFDAAVIFTVCTQSALPAAMMCRLAGIPLRLGHARENPYELLTHWVRDVDVVCDGMRHEVERQQALVRCVGFEAPSDRLLLNLHESDVSSVRQKLRAGGIEAGQPFVLMHPGATAASRRYPAERFGQAADLLAGFNGVPTVYAGGPDDVALVAAARGAMCAASCSLAGDLTFGELAALIDQAAVLVCNNSGPAHVAAALGTPVVVLYALTNPQHTPWNVPSKVLSHDVPCRNCLKSVCPEVHHACLLQITPHDVAEAARCWLPPTMADAA